MDARNGWTVNDSEETGRKRALLIGIRNAKGCSELTGAHDDVHKMRRLLRDIYHYALADITVLLDDELGGYAKPTRANILNAIADLVKDVKAGDRLFFHYSGHSTQCDNPRSNSEEDGKDECIVPVEGESMLIVDNELHDRLVEPLPSGAHLVAVLDTCHSGSLLDLKHYRCNRVFVPWIFRGRRNSEDIWQRVVRAGALLLPANAFATALARILPDEHQRCDSPLGRFPCEGWCRANLVQVADAEVEADVISLASCKDSQLAWEDIKDGVRISMTSALVNILREDPNRSLKDVLVEISHATHKLALERHRQGKRYKRERKKYLTKIEKPLEKKLAILARNPSTRSLVLPPPAPAQARIAPAPTFPPPRWKGPVLARRVIHHIKWLRQILADARRGGYDMDSFQNPELASPQPLDMTRKWRM
ncbi:caspase domain-containing protein [Mycena vulgaris]|nr:caspase domain-containing protein [Mycena vulgaris]